MATIDNYKIKIQVDGEEQVRDLTQSLDGLQTTLNRTAAAGVAAFAALATSAVRTAGDLVDTADALGLNVAKLYQLNRALEQSGGRFGDAAGLFRGFSQSLGDVEKGSSETIDALYKFNNLAGRSTTRRNKSLWRRRFISSSCSDKGRNRLSLCKFSYKNSLCGSYQGV